MDIACAKHKASPVRIYSHCVGCELERLSAENADLRARLEAAERKRDEALALLNEKDAALKAARAHKDDFAWSVERGGHVLERDLTKLLHKRCQQYEADLERVQVEVRRLRQVERLALAYRDVFSERLQHVADNPLAPNGSSKWLQQAKDLLASEIGALKSLFAALDGVRRLREVERLARQKAARRP